MVVPVILMATAPRSVQERSGGRVLAGGKGEGRGRKKVQKKEVWSGVEGIGVEKSECEWVCVYVGGIGVYYRPVSGWGGCRERERGGGRSW